MLVLGAYPAYKGIKKWRAKILVKRSLEDKQACDFMGALEAAQAAYQLEPTDVTIVRNIAQLYAELDPIRALAFWQKVVDLSGSDQDRMHLAHIAIQLGKLELAGIHIQILLKNLPQDPQVAQMAVTWYALNNDLTQALNLARKFVYEDNPPADLALFYVQLTQISKHPGDRIEGINYLRTLAQRSDELGLKALRHLAHYPDNTPAQLQAIANGLMHHPDAQNIDKMLALAIEQKLGLVDTQAVFLQAKQLFDIQNTNALLELARWLNQQQLSTYTVDLISQPQALSRRDIFLVWVDALALNQQWQRLQKIMDAPQLPIEEYLRLIFLARIDLELKQPQQAQNDWDQALVSVGRDIDKLWFMANYAQELNLGDWQRDVLTKLISMPQAMRRAYESLVQLDQRLGNLPQLYEDLTDMHQLFEQDAVVANDWAYAGLMLNQNVAQAIKIAQLNYEKDPEFLSYTITLALSYLRQNKPDQALKLFNGINMIWPQVRAGWQAVYATVLKVNGGNAGAQALYNQIPQDQLFAQEKALYETARVSVF